VEFDNSVAGLTVIGSSATGLVTVSWTETGTGVTNDTVVPVSATVIDSLLYQSDFTGSTLGDGLTNEGIASSGNWVINETDDRAEFDWLLRNGRAALYTTDAFQSTDGFILEVSFLQTVAGARFSIGLVESGFSDSADGDWLNSALPGAYGIGISTTGQVATDAGGDALALNDGTTAKNDFTSITALSTAQGNITFDTLQTLSLTVTADSWSYSLNGAEATTNTTAFAFDTSKSYRYINYIQEASGVRNETAAAAGMQGSYISSITLTALTDPEDIIIGDITMGGVNEAGDLVFSWDTADGQSYNVETNADLVFPSWGVYETIVGDGNPVTVTNTPALDQLFYKVTSE
jgi:hypothetical protein